MPAEALEDRRILQQKWFRAFAAQAECEGLAIMRLWGRPPRIAPGDDGWQLEACAIWWLAMPSLDAKRRLAAAICLNDIIEKSRE